MKWEMIKKDLLRNKIMNLALLLFMVFSSTLFVASILVATKTIKSIDSLYAIANPPHFLQMHKGDYNPEDIEEFMDNYPGLTSWQTVTMVDIYGEDLSIVRDNEKISLSEFRIDIGLVKQNPSKDLLLDGNREKIVMKSGEIGMPILLRDAYDIKIGDKIVLNRDGITKEFVVKEFVLDSMMNSSMCSSTRILLSDKDFDELNGNIGELEYIIEAYFSDKNMGTEFQTAYEDAGCPQNGQAITYSMIFLLSAITDIIMVFVLLLCSGLLILIAFLCLRFTILAALEEDVSEIGMMKAIGYSFRDIRGIYLGKYNLLAIVATVVGIITAVFGSNMFVSHIKNTFGKDELSISSLGLAILSGLVVFIWIHIYCKFVLRKIKKLTVVDALVTQKRFSKYKGKAKDGLRKSQKLSVNSLLGLREVSYKLNQWFILIVVEIIIFSMIMVPINLVNTMESAEFIPYMGSPIEDIMIQVENDENRTDNYQKVINVLEKDQDIAKFNQYARVSVKGIKTDGKMMNVYIDTGDMGGQGLKYLSGESPKEKDQIALSYLYGQALEKTAGDKLTIVVGSEKRELTISGIYQDVTSGGYTAKSINEFSELEPYEYSFLVDLKPLINAKEKVKSWDKDLGKGITVDPMEAFLSQTLGGVVKQVKMIIGVIGIINLALVILISVLFLKLRLVKDQSQIAILRGIGFSWRDIVNQYLIKIGIVTIISSLLGSLATVLLGENLINTILQLSNLGIVKIQLVDGLVYLYMMVALAMIVITLIVTRILVETVKNHKIMSMIKE